MARHRRSRGRDRYDEIAATLLSEAAIELGVEVGELRRLMNETNIPAPPPGDEWTLTHITLVRGWLDLNYWPGHRERIGDVDDEDEGRGDGGDVSQRDSGSDAAGGSGGDDGGNRPDPTAEGPNEGEENAVAEPEQPRSSKVAPTRIPLWRRPVWIVTAAVILVSTVVVVVVVASGGGESVQAPTQEQEAELMESPAICHRGHEICHRPDCTWATRIGEENRIEMRLGDAVEDGYRFCHYCGDEWPFAKWLAKRLEERRKELEGA